ncbi:hypothetical protein C4D60_Mb01t11610 [Musa balbisiana]|uniref:Uncharacterized protein n=1 Tax=Musa balbisiana TaxID=52838 RepID=A0A4S8JMC5_MUSBA|nr:hypothetical protein C4D60_Mb01t11610 [Musa balbisiana]
MAPSSTSYPPLSSASTERVPQQLRVGSVRGLVVPFGKVGIAAFKWIASHGDIWWLATTRRRMTAIISKSLRFQERPQGLELKGGTGTTLPWTPAPTATGRPEADGDGVVAIINPWCGKRGGGGGAACLVHAPLSLLSLSRSPTQDNKHGTPSPGSSQS